MSAPVGFCRNVVRCQPNAVERVQRRARLMHYIVRYIVYYVVHYIVHYVVHYIVHYMVHYIVSSCRSTSGVSVAAAYDRRCARRYGG